MITPPGRTKDQEVYYFNKGRNRVVKLIERSPSKPIIIAVFGVPDSGKTFLIDYLGTHFESRGLRVLQRDNRERINRYESWTERDDFFNPIQTRLKLLPYDLIMYHCPWDERARPWKHELDPEETIRASLDRGLDLTIGIYNPQRSSPPKGDFSLIIYNLLSGEKPYPLDD